MRLPSTWRTLKLIALAVATLLLWSQCATAQPGGGRRGGEGRRGPGAFDRGQGERQEAGGRFGGRGGRGGRFGRGRGPAGASGMEGFLRSLDANGDGLVARAEVPERRRRMLDGIAANAGLSTDRPIPIDDLVNAAASARERARAGGREGGRDRRRSDNRGAPRDEGPMAFGQPGDGPAAGNGANPPAEGEAATRRAQSFGQAEEAAEAETEDRSDRGENARADDRDRAPPRRNARAGARAGSGGDEQSRRSYRFATAAERLPSAAKSWITQRDRDGDGQVAMHEFARVWNDSRVREFAGYDLNDDGLITAAEYVARR